MFRGKNFVFDSRVAVSASTTTVTTTTTTATAAAPSPISTIIDDANGSINDDDDIDDVGVDGRNDGLASNESVSSSSGDGGTMMRNEQESEQEPESGSELVVGRCLDCDRPFDQFSGTVVCTVGNPITTLYTIY